MGFKMRDRDLSKLMQKFDKFGDGLIEYGAFTGFADGGNVAQSSSSSSALDVDDRVEARYKGKGQKWYAGRITRVHRDGTMDIKYDDGDSESCLLYTSPSPRDP